jgi:hypothetical protein
LAFDKEVVKASLFQSSPAPLQQAAVALCVRTDSEGSSYELLNRVCMVYYCSKIDIRRSLSLGKEPKKHRPTINVFLKGAGHYVEDTELSLLKGFIPSSA